VVVLLLVLLAPIGFAGLLLLSRLEVSHRQRSARIRIAEALLATVTGIGTASLTLMLPVLPYVVVPVAVTAYLASRFIARRRWLPLGCHLIGAGTFWLAWEAWSAWNDLTDTAVSRPGWSPLPLGIAAVFAVLGATLLVASRRDADGVGSRPT